MGIVLQDTTFKQLRDYIYEKSGIFISDAKKYFIETRLLQRVQNLKLAGFDEYLQAVKFGTNGDELNRLFDAITTNETFFFRENQHLDLFADHVLTELPKLRKSSSVKIWCAASSTGEEPYTIVMTLREKKPGTFIDIIASDISDAVLASAKKAVYNSYSVRNVSEAYLKKYFKVHDQTYELDPLVKNSVRFMNVNLMDEKKVKTIRDMDVIFCRNVLIYFDDRAKQKVVSLLYDSLRPKGFLFIGASESLHSITRAFRPVIINKTVVYQKI
jgi:chemotaxis protein methyltransferase CheR